MHSTRSREPADWAKTTWSRRDEFDRIRRIADLVPAIRVRSHCDGSHATRPVPRLRFREVYRVEASGGLARIPGKVPRVRAPELPHPKKGCVSGLEHGRTDFRRYSPLSSKPKSSSYFKRTFKSTGALSERAVLTMDHVGWQDGRRCIVKGSRRPAREAARSTLPVGIRKSASESALEE
jgi:hypothetical protein